MDTWREGATASLRNAAEIRWKMMVHTPIEQSLVLDPRHTKSRFGRLNDLCGRTLGQCGVSANATVTVLPRMRGGAQLGKQVKGRSKFSKAPNSSDESKRSPTMTI